MTVAHSLLGTVAALIVLPGCSTDYNRPYMNVSAPQKISLQLADARTEPAKLSDLVDLQTVAVDPVPPPSTVDSAAPVTMLATDVPQQLAQASAPVPLAPAAPKPPTDGANPSTAPGTPAIEAGYVPPEPPKPEEPIRVWQPAEGKQLTDLLADWCRIAGKKFVPDSNLGGNWIVDSNTPITGTFAQAVTQLLSGFDEAEVKPHAEIKPNALLLTREN